MNALAHQVTTLTEFYKNFRFDSSPFDVYTAELETDFIAKTFVHPFNYEVTTNAFSSKRTILAAGNRGTGKTAILTDLCRRVSDNDVWCVIDDYSSVTAELRSCEEGNGDFYALILTSIVRKLFIQLVGRRKSIKKLNKDDKIFLSFLLYKFVDVSTQGILIQEIEKIQLSKLSLFVKKILTPLRGLLNYGSTAASNFINSVISSHFSMLPPVSSEGLRDIIPNIELGVDLDFVSTDVSFRLIEKTCRLIQTLGFERVIVFFDKMDEDNRLSSDAESIAELIKPLLTDNKLLLAEFIQFVVFVWEIPLNKIISEVRTQKLQYIKIVWEIADLERALNKRIAHFSNNTLSDYKLLFADSVSSASIEKVFMLANKNPRDLWHVFNKMLEQQYRIDNSKNMLSEEAIQRGLTRFVSDFNFYEYYPRRKNSRANTMDIYSFASHLLKLPNGKFTKNQLSEYAKTGGSTTNYVTLMEGLGLIKKTEQREGGGVVYMISDPKIVFAMENKIELKKP